MPISSSDLFWRIGTAVILGAAIGYERMVHKHPAGLRTHLLVALASATFMLVSTQFVFFQHYPNDSLLRADVSRIASNVVVGIGFLGGGVILHSGLKTKGLTTAASLWLVAALGLAAGAGMYILAGVATSISLFALVTLRYWVKGPRRRRIHLRVRMDLEGESLSRTTLMEWLEPIGVTVRRVDYSRDLTANRARFLIEVGLAGEAQEGPLLKRLESLPGLRRVQVQSCETAALTAPARGAWRRAREA